MGEFSSQEVTGVINQLQGSINTKLHSDIKRRIVESSQGFPWLTKKLCIHIYNEILNGLSYHELLEQDLNIESLFKRDVERLSAKELSTLKYIAKRAFEGDSFDATEIDEKIPSSMINEIIHKRVVIQTGMKYNIYWDHFRDYLLTGNIPLIGESYIIRMQPEQCLKFFLDFKNNADISSSYFLAKHQKMKLGSVYNILRELMNIGLITKDQEKYKLRD